MKRLAFTIVVSFFLSLAWDRLMPGLCPGYDVVSILYTVSGIMFSIGMSLLITSNTSAVKNKDVRSELHARLKLVRTQFIYCFAFLTLTYVFSSSPMKMNASLGFKGMTFFGYDVFMTIANLISIAFFIINFIAVQKLNEDIEEKVQLEHES